MMAEPGLSRSEVEDYLAHRPGVELQLARSIVRRAVIVGPVLVAFFGLVGGVEGLVASAIGVGLVAGYYLLGGMILSGLAKISLTAYHIGALLGFLIRLVLISVTMLALAASFDLDRVALGLTVIVTYLVLLLWETGAGGRRRKRGGQGA